MTLLAPDTQSRFAPSTCAPSTRAHSDPGQPIVLVVDDDALWRRRLARALHQHAVVRTAASAQEARGALARHAVAAVVLEPCLAAGGGFELFEELRLGPGARPVLVVSRTTSVLDAGRVSALGAAFTSKLDALLLLRAELARLAAAARRLDARLLLVEDIVTGARLTRAEAEALRAFVRARSRAALAHELGIAETSVRSRVRALCRKLGIARIVDVYAVLFERAVGPHQRLGGSDPLWRT